MKLTSNKRKLQQVEDKLDGIKRIDEWHTFSGGFNWPPKFGYQRFYYDGHHHELHLGPIWFSYSH